jgi:ferric hydroxamate transport system substrate-binding protein
MQQPRLVALDWSLIEISLALGLVPIAAAEVAGYRQWVRQPALPDSVADLGLRVQPNLEFLVLLNPSLILTIPERADIAPPLRKIAPLMSLSIYDGAHDPCGRACAALQELGVRLGRREQAHAAIDQFNSVIAAARRRLGGPLPPIVVIRFVDARTVFIFGAGGLFDGVLMRLGLRNGWQGPASRWGFVQTSVVRLAEIQPDCRVFIIDTGLSPDIEAMMQTDPLWLGLPFVRNDLVSRLPSIWFFGATVAAARFATAVVSALAGTADAP